MPDRHPTVLFVDDDADILKTAELLLRKAGYAFLAARNPAEAYSVLGAHAVDVILLDLNFSRAQISGEEGLACLRDIRNHNPYATVLVVTGHSGLTVAVRALRAGAQNFIMKPWSNEKLLDAIAEALQQRKPLVGDALGIEVMAGHDSGLIVGESEAIVRVKALVTRYAPLTASVLLTGEPGTGKSLVAQALHRQSGRSNLKIVEAVDVTMDGLGDLADTTVVFENIDQIDPGLSMSLAAWLQIAGRGNVRAIATTTRSQGDVGIQRGLIYALSTLEMTLPALQDRRNDIELLAAHFARMFALRQGLGLPALAQEAIAALKGIVWKDNLHALRRVIERAVITADSPLIGVSDLDLPDVGMETAPNAGFSLEMTEKIIIEEALKRYDFNISKAAGELGLTRQALYRRMARHGL